MQYGLIGEHLGHSYSPEIHGVFADYKYELKELRPDEVGAFMTEKSFKAINVTIPYKQDVIPYLDWISDRAKNIGAVNTIVNRDGKLYGYNTDFDGMAALARRIGIEPKGKKALILGTGGTSKTAYAVLESMGAAEIYKVSRGGKDGAISYEEAVEKHADAQIIFNTTPAGMYPKVEGKAMELSAFTKLEGVLDVVYNPLRTNLIIEAEERGIPAAGGLYMLSGQAVYACGWFLDRQMDEADTDRAFKKIYDEKRNIVMIGMPSSGKSTVGAKLAELTGKKLVDTDALVIEKIGMPIADYFAQFGEAAFRAQEKAVIAELSVQNGLIIATGGGAVLDRENVIALKRNGTLVFLDRSPEKLIATSDRPLSSDREALMKRYNERYEIYKASADIQVNGDKEVAEVAADVFEELKK